MFLKWIGGGALAGVITFSGIAVQRAAAQSVDLVESSTVAQVAERDHKKQPHGDQAVVKGLIKATANITGLRAADVRARLQAGQSIEGIAIGAGKTAVAVLTGFDSIIDKAMQRAVQNDRLPQSLADARAAWFKQSARLQIDQPGLAPRFPGIHELHVAVIRAAVRVSGIPRADIRAELESCMTLTNIVATKGKTSQDVVDDAMAQLTKALQTALDHGNLTTAQRDEWRAALLAGVNNMVNAPGLHVAGKECAD